MSISLSDPLKLPCGVSLPNRICKAAMTEGLGDEMNRATERHVELYRRWAEGGAGLLLTGNVLVDRRYLERPGNVAIDNNGGEEALRAYAKAGTSNGNELWMQINHPGRQCPAFVNPNPLAPSNVPLGKNRSAFGEPVPMTEAQIEDVIARFVHVATVAKETGFTGIQVHAAHGYLLSNFLSPVTNRRDDKWGGALENRARALLEIVRRCRKTLGNAYPISVKLNSTDFQKGAFTLEDCQQVVKWLGDEGVDLLEISGGTYEQPAMVGNRGSASTFQDPIKHSTREREAYFVEYAKAIQPAANMPLMVTGGFRSKAGMEAALAAGELDVIGLARPLCGDPDVPNKLMSGDMENAPAYENDLVITPEEVGEDVPEGARLGMQAAGQQGWFCMNIIYMGEGREPELEMGCLEAGERYRQNEAETEQRRHKDQAA